MIGYKFPKGIEYLSINNSPEVYAKFLELGYKPFGSLTIEYYCLHYISVTNSDGFLYNTEEYVHDDGGFHEAHLDITEWFTKKYLLNNRAKLMKSLRKLSC